MRDSVTFFLTVRRQNTIRQYRVPNLRRQNTIRQYRVPNLRRQNTIRQYRVPNRDIPIYNTTIPSS